MSHAHTPHANTPRAKRPHATTIGEVIDALDGVVDDAARRRDRVGLFAALYRRTTAAVRDAIIEGRFDDGERMEHLDVVFAERYFDAYRAHLRGATPAGPWRYAFARAAEEDHLLLQHMLLGVNAHISLDLAVAVCDSCGSDGVASLAHDFFVVNEILADMVDRVQDDLNAVSPRLEAFDRLGGPADERLAAAFLARARSVAWRKALAYHQAPKARHARLLARWDAQVVRVSRRICPPPDQLPAPVARVLRWVRAHEPDDMRTVLDAIR